MFCGAFLGREYFDLPPIFGWTLKQLCCGNLKQRLTAIVVSSFSDAGVRRKTVKRRNDNNGLSALCCCCYAETTAYWTAANIACPCCMQKVDCSSGQKPCADGVVVIAISLLPEVPCSIPESGKKRRFLWIRLFVHAVQLLSFLRRSDPFRGITSPLASHPRIGKSYILVVRTVKTFIHNISIFGWNILPFWKCFQSILFTAGFGFVLDFNGFYFRFFFCKSVKMHRPYTFSNAGKSGPLKTFFARRCTLC